jgi:predicted RNase H-like HicB family nuclease
MQDDSRITPHNPEARDAMDEMEFEIETEVEVDGRWIAEIHSIPGVMAYGATKAESRQRVQALALRVTVDQLEQG